VQIGARAPPQRGSLTASGANVGCYRRALGSVKRTGRQHRGSLAATGRRLADAPLNARQARAQCVAGYVK